MEKGYTKFEKKIKSQRTFAREVGISINTLIEAETGRRKLNDRQVTLVCNRFFINKSWLINGQGEKYKFNPKSLKYLRNWDQLVKM